MYRYFIGLFVIPLIGLGAFYFQLSFAQTSVEPEKRIFTPKSSAEFLRWCKSIDTNKREYCEGYIDGMSHFWRVVTACQSTSNTDQSFCAGSMAAREKIQNLRQTCEDCDDESLKQLDQDLVEVVGKCSTNSQVSSSYCEGFNLQVKITINPEFNHRTLGLSLGYGDPIMLLMFPSKVMHCLPPCIERGAESRSIIASIYAFADDYPELLQLDSQTNFLTKALFYGLCPGPMEHLSPHMEHCTNWENKKGSLNLLTDNNCSKPIYIQFKTDSSPVIDGEIDPGERFNTEHYATRYIYTACRTGYSSSVPFSKENWETISRGLYHCVKE